MRDARERDRACGRARGDADGPAESLPPTLRRSAPRPASGLQTVDALPDSGFDLEALVKEIERGYTAPALQRAGGLQVKAAELLGMSLRSCRYYVKTYPRRGSVATAA